jgi:hypothetical protein
LAHPRDNPVVLPVLEAAAANGVAICVHPPVWDKAGDNRFPRYHFANSFGAPLESSLAAMSVVYSGLLDRHPDARRWEDEPWTSHPRVARRPIPKWIHFPATGDISGGAVRWIDGCDFLSAEDNSARGGQQPPTMSLVASPFSG